MIRFLNVLALIAVIGSATWAYSVKYETILVAEKLKKRQGELRKERDAVAVLEAEWQLLNRPARLAALAKPEAGMVVLSARQVAQPREIPAPAPQKTDSLDQLLTGSLPSVPVPAVAPKPATAAPASKAAKGGAPKVPAKAGAPKVVAAKSDAARAGAGHAPLSLTPKLDKGKVAAPAPKISAPKISAPKLPAPKTTARPVPPAPVPPPPQQDRGGLGALFKKIIN